MWLLPLFFFGLAAYAVGSSRAAPSYPVLAPPPSPPGPIAVLGELVRCGRKPPPQLILFAIAEAEAAGRDDIASDIVRLFIAPVVYEYELAHAVPQPSQPQLAARGASNAAATASAAAPSTFPATDEQIRQMLDQDPEKFMEVARRPGGVIDLAAEAVVEVPNVPTASPRERKAGTVIDMVDDDIDLSLPPTSPIASVPAADWARFCERLARETPNYKSNRHVGQYRQNVERLIELGINPKDVLGSARAQREALGVEMADAFQHMTESGDAQKHIGRLIALHNDPEAYTVSLSGMLGVIQCTGLDNAVSWFEKKSDRVKYPHTTNVFRSTNGVF